MTNKRNTLLRSSALAAAGLAAGAVLVFGLPDGLRAATPLSPPSDRAVQTMPNFADVAEAVAPAVVHIQVAGSAPARNAQAAPMPELPDGLRRFFGDEFAERFRNQTPEQPNRPRVQGLGSGFIISADGYIVTNDHVAGEADEIRITLQDGREFQAERLGRDPRTDLVLLKIEADDALPFVKFADATPRVGEWVIAVGSPFGLGNTVTAGIVSAHGRSLGPNGPYDGFMQIDAAINRGNSGGPAFNLKGEVIGVNTAIFSPTGGNVGIGFAVPAETAKSVIAQLKDKGIVERGWLGVAIQAVTPDIAESLGFDAPRGALISNVTPDSPAARAGVEPGDVVVAVNETMIDELRDLPKAIGTLAPGSDTRLKVIRQGSERLLDVEIGQSPDSIELAAKAPSAPRETQLGMALASLDPAQRRAFGIKDTVNGVVVTDIAPDSPAAGKGIRQGDVITAVGGDKVTQPADVVDGIARAKDRGRKAVLLLVERNGQAQYLAVPLGVS